MKPVGLIGTGILLLLLGAVIPTNALPQQHDEDAKPAKQEPQAKPEKQQEAKPAKQEQQAKPAKQQEAKAPKQEQQAKPEKQQAAKPAKEEKQAKPAKEEKQAKPAKEEKQAEAKPEKQEQAKPAKQEKQVQSKPEKQQQENGRQAGQPQGQWAHNGQKDSRGHVYSESRFGRDHHARFEENGGRFYSGRREYSYGGYWFYAGVYPPWFYQQDVYFIMGADGLWYAVAYGDPSLTFQVNIE